MGLTHRRWMSLALGFAEEGGNDMSSRESSDERPMSSPAKMPELRARVVTGTLAGVDVTTTSTVSSAGASVDEEGEGSWALLPNG